MHYGVVKHVIIPFEYRVAAYLALRNAHVICPFCQKRTVIRLERMMRKRSAGNAAKMVPIVSPSVAMTLTRPP